MNCEQTQARFDERLDGRLAAAEAAACDAHLASCPDCRQQWQAFAGAWELLEQHTAIAPSFGFADRTMRRLAETAPTARPWFWQPAWRWAALGLALAALGVGGWRARQHRIATSLAAAYAETQQADYLEDYDVIASLDQLPGQNQL